MLNNPLVLELINLAIKEDLPGKDITSELIISKDQIGIGQIIAREELVFCGGILIPSIIKAFKFNLNLKNLVKEGAVVKAGECIVELAGNLREILTSERTILNFLQRMSGVASLTRDFVKAAGKLKLLDTRKTIPGWRILDKYAVKVGGGQNHRMDLSSMILIKDNHVAAQGGLIKKVLENLDNTSLPVELEVQNLEQFKEALNYKLDFIMLDNFSDQDIIKAYKIYRESNSKIKIEISGGITIDRLKNLNELDGFCVSVGALTTKATNRDMSLEVLNPTPFIFEKK